MLTQSDIANFTKSEIASLITTESSGKAKVESEVATNLKIFLQNDGGDLDDGYQTGTSFRGYVFVNQLSGITIKQNDKLKIGSTIYEVTSDGELMDQNLLVEPFYKLKLEKRQK